MSEQELSAEIRPILDAVEECALAWEPQVCLLGNVTAAQISGMTMRIRSLLDQRADDAALLDWLEEQTKDSGQAMSNISNSLYCGINKSIREAIRAEMERAK